MSYTLIPYLVDLDELRRVVGSKDEAFLAGLIESSPEAFAEEEGEEDGEISLRTALRHLVMGEALGKESAYQYGYALEQLCRHVGEEVIGRDMWSGIGWQVLEATGVEQVLTRSGPPVALPLNDDFPRVGHLKAGEIAAAVAELGDGHLTTAAPAGRKPRRSFQSWLLGLLLSRISQRGPLTGEDLRELLEEYESWLREAAEKNRSLVFFYY